MSTYTDNWGLRYNLPTFHQQIEVAVVTAAADVQNEATSTPDHANRLAWASWANQNSMAAWVAFGWPCAMNATIQASYKADPTGGSIQDSDIQFVVNSNLEAVVTAWVAHPPPA